MTELLGNIEEEEHDGEVGVVHPNDVAAQEDNSKNEEEAEVVVAPVVLHTSDL